MPFWYFFWMKNQSSQATDTNLPSLNWCRSQHNNLFVHFDSNSIQRTMQSGRALLIIHFVLIYFFEESEALLLWMKNEETTKYYSEWNAPLNLGKAVGDLLLSLTHTQTAITCGHWSVMTEKNGRIRNCLHSFRVILLVLLFTRNSYAWEVIVSNKWMIAISRSRRRQPHQKALIHVLDSNNRERARLFSFISINGKKCVSIRVDRLAAPITRMFGIYSWLVNQMQMAGPFHVTLHTPCMRTAHCFIPTGPRELLNRIDLHAMLWCASYGAGGCSVVTLALFIRITKQKTILSTLNVPWRTCCGPWLWLSVDICNAK